MMRLVLAVALLLSLSQIIHADHNVTVDNTSNLIVYQGSWITAVFPNYDYGGSQQLVDLGSTPDAGGSTATFKFTGTSFISPRSLGSQSFSGVAIYFMAPEWPYTVNTVLTLDSDPPVVVSMTSLNTLPIGSVGPNVVSQVLWGRTGLSNTEHTLVASLAAGARYIVVDALMYVLESVLFRDGLTHIIT